MNNFTENINSHLPAQITSASYENENISICTKKLKINSICPWRITSGQKITDSSSMGWPDSTIKNLVGINILDLKLNGIDLIISLSGDLKLEIFSDNHLEPWIVTTPEITYVPNLDLEKLGIN